MLSGLLKSDVAIAAKIEEKKNTPRPRIGFQ